jgi:adenylate cyclase
MGVGLNSGPVMAGSIGAEQRVEYTALGDTTNTASRLEGMTKGTPHMIFVADSTRERMSNPEQLLLVGELEVRGRVQRLPVWTVAEGSDAPPTPEAQGSGEAAAEAQGKGETAESAGPGAAGPASSAEAQGAGTASD